MAVWLMIGVVVMLAGLLAYAATRPDRLTVVRSTVVEAPPEDIYPHIEDLHRWSEWSPWERLDPRMKRMHSGAARGKGAVYEWEGSSKVGQGRMEITDTVPLERVVIRLEFLKPWKSQSVTVISLDPHGEETEVTWSMEGPSPFVAKLMGVFMNMDRMIGNDFEEGLANLKEVAEE